MKLIISQLHEGENRFHFESQKDSWVNDVLTRVQSAGYTLRSPLGIDLNLTKLEPDYYLRGQMQFEVEQTCARCAETYGLPLTHGFDIALAHVAGAKVNTVEISEESEVLDVNFFDGNEIELGPIVEEQFFLSLPYQSLCKEDCQGICQQCGKNRNTDPCRCVETNKISPFSILQEHKFL